MGNALNLTDRCYYVRYDEANEAMYRAAGYHRPDIAPMPAVSPLSDCAIDRTALFATGTIVCNDILTDPRPLKAPADHRALIAVPFIDSGKYSAAFVGVTVTPRAWSREEVNLMERVAALTSAAVASADYVSRKANIASRLQDALQPQVPDRIAGLHLASYYRPALEEARVGGDFVDVFAAGKNTTFLVLGDVSGKGLDAASQVSVIRNMLRLALLGSSDIAGAITHLNAVVTAHEQLNGSRNAVCRPV